MSNPSDFNILRRVVAQHIVDGQMSGSRIAADLARSLITECDAAGVDISADVDAAYANLDEPAAGAR